MLTFVDMKKYWLSFVVLLFLAIITAFSINGTNPQDVKMQPSSLLAEEISPSISVSYVNDLTSSIDVPLPLKNTSEQILHRKSYIVSYNKDTKIPN